MMQPEENLSVRRPGRHSLGKITSKLQLTYKLVYQGNASDLLETSTQPEVTNTNQMNFPDDIKEMISLYD